jgi:hypothetical protein
VITSWVIELTDGRSLAGKPYAIRLDDSPMYCTGCGAEMTTEQVAPGVWALTHGGGEARKLFRYPDDYLAESDPINRWLAGLHEYERGH